MITKKIKLKNKRIEVGRRVSDNNIFIQFSRLKRPNDNDVKKVSATEYIGNKVQTSILVSPSGAVSLFYLLKSELNISDLQDFEKESGQKLLLETKQPAKSLFFVKFKTLLEQYRDEKMPDWNTPFHYDAESWSAMKYFIEWLEQ